MIGKRGRLLGEVAKVVERRSSANETASVEVAEVAAGELDGEEIDPGTGEGKEKDDPVPEPFGAATIGVHEHPDHKGGLYQRKEREKA